MYVRTPIVALLFGFSLLAPNLAAADAPRRIRAPIRDTDLYRLAGSTRPMLALAKDDGEASSIQNLPGMTLHFNMTTQQEEELGRLLQQQQEPHSDQFHKFLTPEEFGARFGANPDDITKITTWLTQAGFSNIQVARSRTSLSFEGIAAQVQTAFHTAIHNYRWDGEKHYSNAGDPQLPQALRGLVRSVRGLNNFGMRPHNRHNLFPRYSIGSANAHFLAPGDIAAIYNLRPLYQSGLNGAGVNIAIAGQSNIQLADIRAFRAASGLPPSDPTIILAGADPGVKQTGDQSEADLDIEWAGGVAPNANILFVTSTNVFNSIFYAIENNVASILSISYGTCELNLSRTESETIGALFRQANAQGITIITASGDSGAAGCGRTAPATRGLAVDFPSSLPYVTAIGGTTFSEDSSGYWIPSYGGIVAISAYRYIPEVGWNDSNATSLASSGGGASIYNAKPDWQTGLGVPNDGARDVPDISFAASSQHDGYLLCWNGSCVNGFLTANSSLYAAGGTSAGAPVFAGILALLVQKLGPQGNVNPALYSLAATKPEAFHDITTGNNIVPCQIGTANCPSGQLGYYTGPGYDHVTGLGSVNAETLINAWSNLSISSANTSKGPLSFIPVTPCRIADTRDEPGTFGGPLLSAGSIREFDLPNSSCNIPSNAAAYALNVTVVPPGTLDYLTLWPSGLVKPYVSTLNSDGRIKANAAIVPAGKNGGVSVYAANATHVILDISGYFVPTTAAPGLQFFPLAPCRIADTRESLGSLGSPKLASGNIRDFPIQSSNCHVPPSAQAYSLNVTVVPSSSLLFVTAWPSGQPQPLASILNAPNGTTTANAAIIPAGVNGSISTYASADTHLVIDINGYFAPPGTGGNYLYTQAPCRVLDSRYEYGQPLAGFLNTFLPSHGCVTTTTAAQAYVLNATVLPVGPLSYLTLWPRENPQPLVSTLNADPDTITSNMAIVPSSNALVSSYATSPTYLILDISAFFAP